MQEEMYQMSLQVATIQGEKIISNTFSSPVKSQPHLLFSLQF
jgi:hypothetical protein